MRLTKKMIIEQRDAIRILTRRGVKGKFRITRDGLLVDGKVFKLGDKTPAPSVKVDVGVMEVKVTGGEDKTLGTPDDVVEVKPKKKKAPLYREVEGGFECNHCARLLKTQKGIDNHVANKVCWD